MKLKIIFLFSLLFLSSCTSLYLTQNGNIIANKHFLGIPIDYVVQFTDGEGNIRYSKLNKSRNKVIILDENKKVLKIIPKKDFKEIMRKF